MPGTRSIEAAREVEMRVFIPFRPEGALTFLIPDS